MKAQALTGTPSSAAGGGRPPQQKVEAALLSSGWGAPGQLTVVVRDALDLRRSQGSRVKEDACEGRTTLKWRRSRVAIAVVPNRSAIATTTASAVPNGRSA